MDDKMTADLVELTRYHMPDEACGFIVQAKLGPYYWPIKNIASNPQHRFEMDPEEMVRAFGETKDAGEKIIGVYHSHPRGPGSPSALDRQYARLHPHLRQWIVTVDGVYEWTYEWSDDGNGS